MPVFSYTTIQSSTATLYKEKGSKFLAFAYPVTAEEDIKQRIAELKKKYFDARHHCFGFVLGADKSNYRAFDDGEPNHSAGDPILGQIRSKNLTNVLVVVVRYFGGVKLGVGGLINAYKQAAEDALNQAIVMECEVKDAIVLNYDYGITSEVMRLVKEFDITITAQEFKERCELKGEVRLKDVESLVKKITLMKAMKQDLSLKLS